MASFWRVIRVLGFGSRAGMERIRGHSYLLRYVQVPGPFVIPEGEDGGPLLNGVVHGGTLTRGDLDVWTFTAGEGDGFMVRMGIPPGTTLLPWMRLYGPEGDLVGEALDSWSGNRDNYIALEAPVTGQYTVVVSAGQPGQTGDYIVGLGRAPIEEGDQDQPLINGTRHSAELARGALGLWSFAASEGEGIMVRMGAPGGVSLTPWIRVYGPDGALLDEAADSWTGNRDNFVLLEAPSSGLYTVIVSAAHRNQSGSYAVQLGRAPVRDGDEDKPMMNGLAHEAELVRGGLDVWSFAAQADDGLVVRMGALAGVSLTPWIRVYGPDGELLAEAADSWTGNRDNVVTLEAPSSGVYTVMLSAAHLNQSGFYNFQLGRAPVRAGDEHEVMEQGVVYPAELVRGGVDVWSFAADAGTDVAIWMAAVTGSALTPWIRLYGPEAR
jgi:hypothetical protein